MKINLLTNKFIEILSSSLVNQKDIDKTKLNDRFTDIVMNSLSLIDDYLQESQKTTYIISSSNIVDENFKEMIFNNIQVLEDKKDIVLKALSVDLHFYLYRHKMPLQSGFLFSLDKNLFIKVILKENIKPVKSTIEIISL